MGCSLCGTPLPAYPILDETEAFCCHGCYAVYQILTAKGGLDNFQQHPVFRQAVKAGLISNESLLKELSEKKLFGQPTDKLYLEIGEMWCPSCAELIRLVLLRERGVAFCTVDYSTDLAVIEFYPQKISKEVIKGKIAALGYEPRNLDAPEKRTANYRLYFRFIIAAFCSLNVMMFAYPLYATYFSFDEQGYGRLFSWLSLVVSLPVVTYCAWPIYSRAWSALLVGIVGMECLVTMGVAAAFAFSLYDLLGNGTQVYFDSMTVVVVFVLLGKIIETRAKFSAKSSLIRLHKGIPNKGRKQAEDGRWLFVPAKEIAVGDILQVRQGEKVPLDGVVRKGEGTCDESLMTGEPMPVPKRVGETVLAGSVLQKGYFEVEVTSSQEGTALHRIMQLIESDITHKSEYVRAVDPWVKRFVPLVLLFAVAVFVFWLPSGLDPAARRMMAVLLISCPCAIGIAAPLAESHLMQALASLGAVVRNRGALRFLGRETAFVFDKTGTITQGRFEVLSGLNDFDSKERGVLKAMTSRSVHPISVAIADALQGVMVECDAIEEVVGCGVRAFYEGAAYYLGSKPFLLQHGFPLPEWEGEATTVFWAREGWIPVTIVLGDKVRNEAPVAVAALEPAKTVLLSGDAAGAVKAVAAACNFDQWEADASPLRKREVVEGMKREGEIVCFVGDGINDAPALTAATVGISVVAASDISIQVSDILLTTDRLTVIPQICRLGRKAHAIIRQNLFWAFFYNFIGIGLAAAGWLSPIFAAAAMVASSFIVLGNAHRLSKPLEKNS